MRQGADMTDDLEALAKSAQEMLAEYWKDDWILKVIGFGFGHGQVNAAIAQYFSQLHQLGPEKNKEKILEIMRRLYDELDRINKRYFGMLLETDEREFLVPLTIQAAKAAGLNIDEFEWGDPTLSFRNF
jgi:hypothetical protein